MTRTRKLLFSVVVLGIVGSLSGAGTYAAFTNTTGNGGNSFDAGTVNISDNDAGASVLTLTNARPGDSATGCIDVTYTGSLDAEVHLYGSQSGSLATYLTLTITRGTDASPSFPGCGSFNADATDYNGDGPGVIYKGDLSAFPATYGGGVVDPKGASPETWTTSEDHVYKLSVTLQNVTAAQGLSSTASFTWEARNQ